MMNKKSSDGRIWTGAFTDNGLRAPEISWHFNDKDEAIKIAKQFNQVFIWDHKNCLAIITGGTGIRKK